jgi:hypothetical protein
MNMRYGHSFIKIALLIAVLPVLTSCGHLGSAPSRTNDDGRAAYRNTNGTAARKVGACALITKEEAAAVLGKAITEATPESTNPVGSICGYTSAAKTTLVINLFQPSVRLGTAKMWTQQKENEAPVRSVPGIGDDAFEVIADKPKIGTSLYEPKIYVLKDSLFFVIAYETSNNSDPLPTLKALATKALSRLP